MYRQGLWKDELKRQMKRSKIHNENAVLLQEQRQHKKTVQATCGNESARDVTSRAVLARDLSAATLRATSTRKNIFFYNFTLFADEWIELTVIRYCYDIG